MTQLTDIKNGIKTRLETIPDFVGKVYPYIPGTQEPPSVTIVPGTFIPGDTKAALTYTRHFTGTTDYVFTLAVVVSTAHNLQAALDLDAFISPDGSKSIKAAIEGDDTLGGVVSFTSVDRVIQYGSVIWNGLNFFGAQVILEVKA